MKVTLDTSLFPDAVTVYDNLSKEEASTAVRFLQPSVKVISDGGSVLYQSGTTTSRYLPLVFILAAVFVFALFQLAKRYG